MIFILQKVKFEIQEISLEEKKVSYKNGNIQIYKNIKTNFKGKFNYVT